MPQSIYNPIRTSIHVVFIVILKSLCRLIHWFREGYIDSGGGEGGGRAGRVAGEDLEGILDRILPYVLTVL